MQILTVTGFYGQSRANILGDENVIEYCNIAETIRPCTVLESCNLFPGTDKLTIFAPKCGNVVRLSTLKHAPSGRLRRHIGR